MKSLADFVAIQLWGECRKDYIILAVNQWGSWSVMTPTVCNTVLETAFQALATFAGIQGTEGTRELNPNPLSPWN